MQIGDRVSILPGTRFADQAKCLGRITEERGPDDDGNPWWFVVFDNGYTNAYKDEDLEIIADMKMPEPDMDLSEIEAAQRIYEELR